MALLKGTNPSGYLYAKRLAQPFYAAFFISATTGSRRAHSSLIS